ncbi:hypothetical protein HBI23_250830 [Parastagonospora nodorum]|nr:hypothetical protein HBI23_250830 [Parastagonospora nodorum]KAH5621702.1 hypothetical protein HBI51_249060 [Parastagonospora nodorum]KAH6133535.1 hypothetical protein HBI68_252140 [Parastagonospora nodorum]KAH6380520.1 hypothetical protein HBI08_236300 [Parastagonospora nodorum]KAH6383669.1 hypothetical protein HBI60_254750 [Parastagonospora nodorum]
MVLVRAPAQPPSSSQHRQLHILFRHPSYDDGSNVLFKLQAPDADDHGQPGLLAQFTIDACTIIVGDCAGSRGWLSLSRDGSTSIDPPARCANVATISTSMPPTSRIPSYRTSTSGHTRTIAFFLTGKNSVLTQILPRRASPSHPPT